MKIITRTEYLNILLDSYADVVESIENSDKANVTILIVNNIKKTMRIISSDGVVYFKLM